jgi:GNAT superfamily N-acetyltransferase
MSILRTLETCAFNAWPAQHTLFHEGWVLRLTDGYTKRANSANAWQPTAPLEAVLPYVESLYHRHGLPTVFRLSPLAGEATDQALEAAGYALVNPTYVMTLELDELVIEKTTVRIEAVLSPTWSAGFAALHGLCSTNRHKHDLILRGIAWPVAYATVYEKDEPVAYGLAVAEGGWVGVFDLIVHPSLRGQGIGRQLINALLAWGQQQGARCAYLQVTGANLPALGLYESLGFRTQYGYHYRISKNV